ncbi:MAG: hypothetical protein Q7J85_14410 [Bacillota bacterium]|nr:hypothetical protein [Bacillota bacterium]
MSNYLYKESNFSKFTAGIFVLVIGGLLFTFIYQILVGPLGTNPASNGFLVIMILIFLAAAVNFSRLSITINPRGVLVGYGIIKHIIPWESIEGCYLDKTSAVMYGGWGIRLGRVKGKWRVVYNIIEGDRVVLMLNRGWYREFVFSTRNPQKVIDIIKNRK